MLLFAIPLLFFLIFVKPALSFLSFRGMKDDDGVEFVAYLTPSVETLQKRFEDKEAGRPYEEGSM